MWGADVCQCLVASFMSQTRASSRECTTCR